MNDLVIRETRPDEWLQAVNTKNVALLQAPVTEEVFEKHRPAWEQHHTSYSAWDKSDCVGHASYIHAGISIPGGTHLPSAAVTRVGVLATHRRRGAARGLIESLVREAGRAEFPIMTLWASEPGIYPNFGFGMSNWAAQVTFDPRRVLPFRGAAQHGSLRLLKPAEIVPVIETLSRRLGADRPGYFVRPRVVLERNSVAAVTGSSAEYVVAYEVDGVVEGYARYEISTSGFDLGMYSRGVVRELFATSPSIELALWTYIASIDLIDEWQAPIRPVDDLARTATADPRAWQTVRVEDEQWIRLIDIDRCLAERTYRECGQRVTIAVADRLVEGNNGTWEINDHGVRRTDATPEIAASIEAVSAAYLGGTSWYELVSTGRAQATKPDAVRRADLLFGVERSPFCGVVY